MKTEEYRELKNENKILLQMIQDLQKEVEFLKTQLQQQEKDTQPEPETEIDVQNVLICLYDENNVGLFKKQNWNSAVRYTKAGLYYQAGSIYTGVDSNHIGVKTTHDGMQEKNAWQQAGTTIVLASGRITSDCTIQQEIGFDHMRMIMNQEKKLGAYNPGRATPSEIEEVLSYAATYYNQKKETEKSKM